MAKPTFTWLESVDAILPLGDQWDATLESWGIDNVFLRWDWIRTWLEVFGPTSVPLVGIASDGDRPIGIAPLVLVRDRVTPLGPSVRSIRLLGDGPLCPDHLVLPAAPGLEGPVATALFDALQERSDQWDRIELRDLYGDHPAWRAFETAARGSANRVVVKQRTHCPYIELPEGWDDYLETLSGKLRKSIRYGLRRLDRDLSVEIVEPASLTEVDQMMGKLEELHARAWHGRGTAGVFADPLFQQFHRKHARRAYEAGRLWLVAMRAKGKELAVFLGFRVGRGGVYYQLGHDPDLSSYSLGTMMVASCIRHAIEQRFAEMDFLRGADAYKYRLAKWERRGHDLTIHRGTLSDRATSTAWWVRRKIGGGLRSRLGRQRVRRLKARIGID